MRQFVAAFLRFNLKMFGWSEVADMLARFTLLGYYSLAGLAYVLRFVDRLSGFRWHIVFVCFAST